MIRDPFNPKFVFHAPVVVDDPTRPLDRARFVRYVEGAIAAWSFENGIDPAATPTVRDVAIEVLEPCAAPSMRIDLWVEALDATSCVYGFLCSSDDGLVPYARGEETVVKIDPRSRRPAAWSPAFRQTQERLMKDLPGFA
jgi:acyl-CoA thioester hydrolase